VEILGRQVPVTKTARGERAVLKDAVIEPKGVERYLAQKFGDALEEVTAAIDCDRRHAEELTPVRRVDVPLADDLREGLVDECRRLQGVVRSVVKVVPPRDPAKLVIHLGVHPRVLGELRHSFSTSFFRDTGQPF
jgi:hypothetical protein